MDEACLAFPVLASKTEDARVFFDELETQRKSAYAASEQRINITRESWHLQQTPQGDLLLVSLETPASPMRWRSSRNRKTSLTGGSSSG